METTFMGKLVTRKQVIDALHEFVQKYPDTDTYENWLQKGSYKYAIQYDGRVYPPKHVLSVVTGIPTTDFNGGEQTNRVFRQLGFDVVNK
jgi:hypothetical protein